MLDGSKCYREKSREEEWESVGKAGDSLICGFRKVSLRRRHVNRGTEPCIHLGKALGRGESTARSEMGEGLVCLRNKKGTGGLELTKEVKEPCGGAGSLEEFE